MAKKVCVAGPDGMVGKALRRRLASENCEIVSLGRKQADLRRQSEVEDWFAKNRPHTVFMAAAKVGGILANASHPADFLYDNLMIEANVFESARQSGVEKLVFLGSSCIYPKLAPQPIAESTLLTGPLEPTNEWYAVAKIAGIKLGESYRRQYGCDFISLQPTNLYGPGDNFDLLTSHVVPALIRKAHAAKEARASCFTVWGSGTPLREFMHVDDLADAVVFLAKEYSSGEHINVGSGDEISIRKLAELVAQVVGFRGMIVFDSSKPDGTPRKLLDTSNLSCLGWSRQRPLELGLADTYRWFLANEATRPSSRPRE